MTDHAVGESPAEDSDPAERYRRVADGFGATVDAVPDGAWDRAAPCDGWVARDVVAHLAGWVPGFMGHFAGLHGDPLPDCGPDGDPAAAWRALDRRLRGWLDDPTVAATPVDGPMGRTDVAGAIDQYVTPDVLIHTWDLARACGLDDRLDTTEVERMARDMTCDEQLDQVLRSSGHYGPKVAVAEGADPQDRLLAFLGRDPAWRPPA